MKSRITNFIQQSVDFHQEKTYWQNPLVGFAKASDPLFHKLKLVIDKDHALPTDFLEDAETVISYFIPFQKEIPLSNIDGKNASRQWAKAYVKTNELISTINEKLSQKLREWGFDTAVPPTKKRDEETLVSTWSQKHIGYISGLGNFGIHHMLITEKGCCGRLGSVITNAIIRPTDNPFQEYCLYNHDESCTACAEKCTFDALKPDSFDKHLCYEICLRNGSLYAALGEANVCGKCICTVPCSFTNPVEAGRN